MIRVSHLTKRYGSHEAVSDLNFHIEKGAVYGFLGANGAGKSTTMNIIAGCLSATSGTVLIAGHDLLKEPLKAKRAIGYLPEIPPVYMDMTPREYLKFVLEAKGIAKKEWAQQLNDAMEKTGITHMQNRLIRNLSKGYRQRVGIAQALLGNPEIIILDEPTVGLDPAQIKEIRALIRSLKENHTVILSSHILSEIQAVCDSVLIIAGGRIKFQGTAEDLKKHFWQKRRLHVLVSAMADEALAILQEIPGIAHAETEERDGGTLIILRPEGTEDVRPLIFEALKEHHIPLLEMTTQEATLEEVFLEVTGQDTPFHHEAKEEETL